MLNMRPKMPKNYPAAQALDDAITAQKNVVNQLAEEHSEAHVLMSAKGEQLHRAHAELVVLLNKRIAGR